MITRKLFDGIFPTTGLTSEKNLRKYNLVRERDKLIDALNRILPKYGINNYLRICAFLGNCGIETDFFKTTVEYASGDDYDTRTSLGNTPARDGDGRLYKGRGLTQTTGKYNYEQLTKAVGREVGIDFVKHPERLAEVEIAVLSACVFWKDHNLNARADRGEFKKLSAIVNRGDEDLQPMHWTKRNELYSLCKRRIPQDFNFAPKPLPIVSPQMSDQNTQTVVLTPTEQTTPTGQSATGSTVINNSTSVVVEQPVAAKESALKRLFNKYWAHCPGDSVKNILLVVFTRISTCATALWNLGVSGKILAFLIAFGAIVPIVWAIVKYRARIWGWIEQHAETFLPGE